MSESDHPSWYQPGDVPSTIASAQDEPAISVDQLVTILAENELDAPQDRIQTMVSEALSESLPESSTVSEPGSLDSTRAVGPRFVDPGDVQYLDIQEFAALLGMTLERFEGTARSTEMNEEVAIDLLWNRTHHTVGIKVYPRSLEEPVGRDDVEHVAEGVTTPRTGRAPSKLCIVTCGEFTELARDRAERHEIDLFDRSHLRRWFTTVKLPHEVLGHLSTDADDDADDAGVVEGLPELPKTVSDQDPLTVSGQSEWDGTTDEDRTPQVRVKQPSPVAKQEVEPGEKGRLYADPDNDGDYGAFDRFMQELSEDDE